MSKQYFVSHDQQDQGPYTLEVIAQKLSKGELVPTDYIYDEGSKDWCLIMEFAPLKMAMTSIKKPTHKVEPTNVSASSKEVKKDEWYILKGENKYGPFSYTEVVRMLQEKSVYEYDYMWTAPMESWMRVAELDLFKPESIKKLISEQGDGAEVFYRRKHVRAGHQSSIIIHNNKNVWKGQSVEISEGGAGIVMYNSMVLPGEKIYLHFKPTDGVPPFNALCEVVSKRYEKHVIGRESPITYGVKFISIHAAAKKALRDYVVEKKTA